MVKYCPKCGEELVDDAKFCKSCGSGLNENVNVNTTQQYDVEKVENDHKLAVIAGYILAILIPLFGIIIGIYLVTRNDSEKANRHGKYIIIVGVLIWLLSFITMMF